VCADIYGSCDLAGSVVSLKDPGFRMLRYRRISSRRSWMEICQYICSSLPNPKLTPCLGIKFPRKCCVGIQKQTLQLFHQPTWLLVYGQSPSETFIVCNLNLKTIFVNDFNRENSLSKADTYSVVGNGSLLNCYLTQYAAESMHFIVIRWRNRILRNYINYI
jgi:hypothetical protein